MKNSQREDIKKLAEQIVRFCHLANVGDAEEFFDDAIREANGKIQRLLVENRKE